MRVAAAEKRCPRRSGQPSPTRSPPRAGTCQGRVRLGGGRGASNVGETERRDARRPGAAGSPARPRAARFPALASLSPKPPSSASASTDPFRWTRHHPEGCLLAVRPVAATARGWHEIARTPRAPLARGASAPCRLDAHLPRVPGHPIGLRDRRRPDATARSPQTPWSRRHVVPRTSTLTSPLRHHHETERILGGTRCCIDDDPRPRARRRRRRGGGELRHDIQLRRSRAARAIVALAFDMERRRMLGVGTPALHPQFSMDAASKHPKNSASCADLSAAACSYGTYSRRYHCSISPNIMAALAMLFGRARGRWHHRRVVKEARHLLAHGGRIPRFSSSARSDAILPLSASVDSSRGSLAESDIAGRQRDPRMIPDIIRRRQQTRRRLSRCSNPQS